jgi:hypothetical protein
MDLSSIPVSEHEDSSFGDNNLFTTKTDNDLSDPVGVMSPKFGDSLNSDLYKQFEASPHYDGNTRNKPLMNQKDAPVYLTFDPSEQKMLDYYVEKVKRDFIKNIKLFNNYS